MTARGIYTGYEESDLEHIPSLESFVAFTPFSTAAERQHIDSSGDLHGLQCAELINSSELLHRIRNTTIPWEEVVFDIHLRFETSLAGSLTLALRSGGSNYMEIRKETDGTHTHRIGTTEVDTTGVVWAIDENHSLSGHMIFDASNGVITSWLDGSIILDSQTEDTEASGVDCDGFHIRYLSSGTAFVDDLGFRPRTMLVTGVTSLDTATPTAVSGVTSGETATVYAWENDSEDSSGGPGDPLMSPGEWRLYLKLISFLPDADVTASGFLDGETITVTGLAGPIICNAPAGYSAGLEPGSQLFLDKLHILHLPVSGVGTENSDGTLTGGAADRFDALSAGEDGKHVRHTATSESVTLAVTGLSAPISAKIDEVIGLQVSLVGLGDGGTVSNFKSRVLDNGGSGQNSQAVKTRSANANISAIFNRNGSGGQWVSGSGAAGINSAEPGYETA
jgi:hypothetical protein